ncbi:TetR/AcrR family transcriptional regulator [Arthrobacter sp. MMS18-M83]|uniref:TetR/AcrR family transcriptional regulator n=1 Tax=Arthrobacter sp. MMS18-M83 TaxID=2996261 RepID=UPI00227AF76C|nr:TetR/AcrR family transcriptional regulator [Arthrobacter sp. MMS18-M83]WAH97628.1 helix-turn-helix domain containing protein [Arthrobacter sp. MMS18-M83]
MQHAELAISPARRRKAEDIETKAWILFAEHGFSNVTMDQVASAAGCSIRTVTRLFPTKEDLLLIFMRSKNARILAEFDAIDPNEPGILNNLWRCWVRMTHQVEEAGLEGYSLFRQASARAPEVADRVAGEQQRMLQDRILLKLRSSRNSPRPPR